MYTNDYRYPHIIEFLDSITNLALILFVPSLAFFIAYFFYSTYLIGKQDNRFINTIITTLLVVVLGSYFYYTFFVLDYFYLFKEASMSIIMIIMYVAFSPFILMYIIFTSTNIEHSLFLNSDFVVSDIKYWLYHKFGIDISSITKESFLFFFKFLTLFIFSNKIINVTRFIIGNVKKTEPRKDLFIALSFFSVFMCIYIYLNQQEIRMLFEFGRHTISVMFDGEMK